jgi:hypothetical protein
VWRRAVAAGRDKFGLADEAEKLAKAWDSIRKAIRDFLRARISDRCPPAAFRRVEDSSEGRHLKRAKWVLIRRASK